MSEDRAIFLWRLERLFEFEGCQHLMKLSGGKEGFRNEILSKKDNITKSCPTGKWMFDGGHLRDVDKFDIAELTVIMNNTNLRQSVDQELRKSFNVVKAVRNYLAHNGQAFGVDENIYQQNLDKLKSCLNLLKVDQSKIDERLTGNVTPKDKEEYKKFLIETSKQIRKDLMFDLNQCFLDYEEYNIGKYVAELVQNGVLKIAEKAIIDHEIAPVAKNLQFHTFMSTKDLKCMKKYVDLMIRNDEELAQVLQRYFSDVSD